MKFKSVISFFNGIFEHRGEETRVDENFLIKQQNLDITPSGVLKRRRGYFQWEDLQNSVSAAAVGGLPIDGIGFQNKIQAIHSFVDYSGKKYIIVISNGKVFLQRFLPDTQTKIWECLNPSGNLDLIERNRPIEVKGYLDTIFINDIDNNLYMFNPTTSGESGVSSLYETYIYFAGDYIYFRDINFNALKEIFIDNTPDPSNTEGNEISQGFVNAGFTLGQLNLRYARKVGDEISGFDFFVLNTFGDDDYLAIIKMDSRFIVKDFVSFSYDGDYDKIISFGYANNKIYLFCEPGIVYIIDRGSLATTTLNGSDIQYAFAPGDGAGSEFFSIGADERNFYLISDFAPYYAIAGYTYNIREAEPGISFDKIPSPESNVFGSKILFDGKFYWQACWTNENLFIYKINTSFDVVEKREITSFTNSNGLKHVDITLEDRAGTHHVWIMDAFGYQLFDFDTSSGTFITYAIPGGFDNLRPVNIGLVGSNRVYVNFSLPPSYDQTDQITETLQYFKIDTTEWVVAYPPHYYARQTTAVTPYGDFMFIGAMTNNQGSEAFRIWDYNHVKNEWGAGVTVEGFVTCIITDGTYIYAAIPERNIIKKFDFSLGFLSDIEAATPFSLALYSGKLYSLDIRSFENNYNSESAEFYLRTATSSIIEIIDTTLEKVTSKIFFDYNLYDISNLTLNDKMFLSVYRANIKGTGLFYDTAMPYLALCAFGFTGEIRSEIYLFGKNTDTVVGVSEIVVEDGILYAGIEKQVIANGVLSFINKHVKIPITNFNGKIDVNELTSLERFSFIDNTPYWSSIRRASPDNFVRISFGWTQSPAVYENTDLTSFDSYSNLVRHFIKQSVIGDSTETIDRIYPIGVPKPPYIEILEDDLLVPSTFLAGTELKYYTSFLLFDGSNTLLSKESSSVLIPQALPSLTVVSVTPATNILNIPTHGLVDDDIVVVTCTLAYPDPLNNVHYYYVIWVDNDNIKLSETPGGAEVDITTAGTGTVYVTKKNNQPVKIKLSQINLIAENGQTLYETDVINKIQIYRSQKDLFADVWTEPSLIAVLEKDAFDEWYYEPLAPPYAVETYEDNVQSIAVNPFSNLNVLKKITKNILIHKNRLILVNNLGLQSKDGSLIQFSATDNTQSLAPENVLSIQSGDGDILIAGISAGDYCYLFKRNKIYAILGDVADGQLLDIAHNIGCPYKNMITSYDNRVIFFLNQYGIYAIESETVVNLDQRRLVNYFDPNDEEAIDFSAIDTSGFSFVDLKNREVCFYVPQKNNQFNSFVIIYEIDYKRFKIYTYAHPVCLEANVLDVQSGDLKALKATSDGNIFETSADLNDNGEPIPYLMRTKQFNITSNFLNKKFNLIKVFGKFLSSLHIAYWLDNRRYAGVLALRKSYDGKGDGTVFLTTNGMNNTIAVEISGEDTQQPPIEIEEILIGYDVMRGIFR